MIRRILWVFLFALTTIGSDALAQMNAGRSKAKVELLPSVEAVVAGQPFELALKFTIQEDWHIYWQHSGDAGQPPSVRWFDLPEGWSISAPKFPVPKRHSDAGGLIITNILEGEPVLLMTVTPPPTVASDRIDLKGKLTYLVCEKNCLPGSEDLKLSLPIVAAGSAPKPANKDLFDAAARQLPKKESKHLRINPKLAPAELKTGQPFELVLGFEVSDGFKIQSNAPLQPEFIAADVFTQSTPGVIQKRAEFPEPKIREMAGLGKVAEFSGSFEVRVPAELNGDPTTCPVVFGGVVTFQACNQKGICSPPEAIQFSLSLPCTQVQKAAAGEDASPDTTVADGHETAGPPSTATGSGTPVDSGKATGATSLAPTGAPKSWTERMTESLLGLLLLGFLGGLILNVMPCVLPVISIKVLSFVQQGGEEPGRVFRLGLTFMAGILVSFWILATVIVGLKEGGKSVGWGFMFADPRFVIGMSGLVFLFALSLFGVFHITLPGTAFNKLAVAETKEGYAGAFAKGLLGTVLATPCTAPFLGPALGVAFKSSNVELFAIFTAIGVGMAFPFLLLTANPGWMKWMPKPGAWMETFKQLMGFTLVGTVIWLMRPLPTLIGGNGLLWSLIFLCFVAMSAWMLGKISPLTPSTRRFKLWAGAILIVTASWWFLFERNETLKGLAEDATRSRECPATPEDCGHLAGRLPPAPWKRLPWLPWSKGLPERLASCGYTVYVDFTAEWCATCLANKAVALDITSTRTMMADGCVVPLKADFTAQPENMLQEIVRFGRSGVPLNLVYPAGKPDEPITMPEFLTPDIVHDALEKAGKSGAACPADGAVLTLPTG